MLRTYLRPTLPLRGRWGPWSIVLVRLSHLLDGPRCLFHWHGTGRRKSGRDKGSAGRKGSGSRRDRTNSSESADARDPAASNPPEPPSSLPGMDANSSESPAYSDPMGQMPERPKTAAARKGSVEDDDDWGDDGTDLLPE